MAFNNPIYIKWNDESELIQNEQLVVTTGAITTLSQIPEEFQHVQIDNMFEVKWNNPIINSNQFSVNYRTGIITFHPDKIGETITVNKYYGLGVLMYPASRIYDNSKGIPVDIDSAQTLQDYINSISQYGYQGDFDITKTYEPNSMVYYDTEKTLYRCKMISVGIPPTNATYWQPMIGVKSEASYAKTQGDYAKAQGDYAASLTNDIASQLSDKVSSTNIKKIRDNASVFEYSLDGGVTWKSVTSGGGGVSIDDASTNSASTWSSQKIDKNIQVVANNTNPIMKTVFNTTSLPAEFVANGGFSPTINGVTTPASGNYSTILYWNKYTTLERSIFKTRILSNNASSVFALVRKPPSFANVGGTIIEFNGGTNKINIYPTWDGSSSVGAVLATFNMQFSLTVGTEFDIVVERIEEKTIVTVTVVATGENYSIKFDNEELYYANTKFAGNHTGYPGIAFISGSITIKRMSYTANLPKYPKVAIFGDSIVEGDSLLTALDVGGYNARWAYLTFKSLLNANNYAVVSGRGGEDSTGLIQRLDIDLDKFKPEYVLLMIGTNDTVYSTWKTNYDTIISRIVSNGAIPILCTMPPRSDRQTFLNQANTYIKSLSYDVIDFDSLLSSSVGTWNPGLVMGDGIHPNALGHSRMAALIFNRYPDWFVTVKKYKKPLKLAPTFQNGWANCGNGNIPCCYWKDEDGYVHLEGMAKNAAATTATYISVAFNMPEGFRPQYEMRNLVLTGSGTGYWYALPDGKLYLCGLATNFISLSGVSYYVGN